jgi:hypothetical protein
MSTDNAFIRESSLMWDSTQPDGDEAYRTTDGRYIIQQEASPWEPNNPNLWVWRITVNVRGDARFYNILATAPTLADAIAYAERDSNAPVFNDHGECRWCGMEKAYLVVAPRWWFGCNLCETTIETETKQPDREYEPLHD